MKADVFQPILEREKLKREPLADDIDALWVYEYSQGGNTNYRFELQIDSQDVVRRLHISFVSEWDLRPSLYPPGQGPYQYLEKAHRRPPSKKRIACVTEVFQKLIEQFGLNVPAPTEDNFAQAGFQTAENGRKLVWRFHDDVLAVLIYDHQVTDVVYSKEDDHSD